jgi:triacylglycerol lipase
VTLCLAALLTLLLALAACGGSAASDPNPVLLVHGWAGRAEQMEPMRARFEQAGRRAYTIELPGNDNIVNAGAIADEVAAIKAETGAEKVDLVGYSMGGLSTRYYVKRLGGDTEVGVYAGFGVPQYGGDIACVLGEEAGGQMCPGSDFLNDLNAGDDTPGDISYTTIWSVDEVPESAGHLDGGACFLSIPDVHHVDEPASQEIFYAVLQAIEGTCPGTFETQPIE